MWGRSSSPGNRLLTAARLAAASFPILAFGGQVYADSGTEAHCPPGFGRLGCAGGMSFSKQIKNTTQNAAIRHNSRRKVSRPILVTSAFHMPRWFSISRNGGIEVVSYPAVFGRIRSRGFSIDRLRPQSDALSASAVVLQEQLRTLVTIFF